MNAVLPLAGVAPASTGEPIPQSETAADGETFESVLDRRQPSGKPGAWKRDEACLQRNVGDVAPAEAPEQSDVEEAEETGITLPPPVLGLVLPALPYHPVAAVGIAWTPDSVDAPPSETSDDGLAGTADAGESDGEKPAHNAGSIFAGQGADLPILTAMFPVPMSQLKSQSQVGPALPSDALSTASTPQLHAATPPLDAGIYPVDDSSSKSSIPMPPLASNFTPAMRVAPESPTVTRPVVRDLAAPMDTASESGTEVLPIVPAFAPGVSVAPGSLTATLPIVRESAPGVRSAVLIEARPMVSEFAPTVSAGLESLAVELPVVREFAPVVRFAPESMIGTLQIDSEFTPAVRTVSHPPATLLPVLPNFAPAARVQTELQAGRLPIVSEFAFTEPEAQIADSIALPTTYEPLPPLTLNTVRLAPRLPGERTTAPTTLENTSLPLRDAGLPLSENANATEFSVVDDVLQARGTAAAKRGEVMHDIPFQPPPLPRVAKSAGEQGISQGSPVLPIEAEAVGTPHSASIASHRTVREAQVDLRPAPPAAVQPEAVVKPEVGATVSTTVQIATPVAVDKAARSESELHPVQEIPVKIEADVPGILPTLRPEADRVKTEPVSPGAPISRTELVQIVERTADAAVRMRAAGTERVEVALQLASGDRLTIHLRFANGEVTPYFRTTSEGLRTALEQNWAQFSDRASDRGVRMTPPVFDANQSSSNMSDFSQQRHGRDTAYADAQAELFPNLPRQMRPPRVGAAARTESSAPPISGVRTYA